jgi:hypothetical protein
MREAMTGCGLAPALQERLFRSLAPLAHQMVNAGDDVPREPLGDAVME